MRLETLQESMVVSMKTHATAEVEVLRGAIAAVKKAAIDKRCEITEALVDEILIKEQKIIEEMIAGCPSNRPELLAEYERKLSIIKSFAPQIIENEEEIHFLITAALANAGIEPSTENKGQIMKTVMPVLKGKVNMKIANQVISTFLK